MTTAALSATGRARPVATLVTGASSGIGAAIRDRILADGGHVVNVSNRPEEVASAATTLIADLTDAGQTGAAIAEALAAYDVRGFVHCAGLPHMAPIDTLDLEDFRRITDLHLRAAMQCISLLTPGMRAGGGGHVVLIGSRVSLGRVDSSLYGAVKSAILGLARGLAVELAPAGINVNVVSPGPVDTPLLRTYHPPGAPQTVALERSIPMGRIAAVDDVAHAVMFFLGDGARYITGQNLFVCGGLDIAAARPREGG